MNASSKTAGRGNNDVHQWRLPCTHLDLPRSAVSLTYFPSPFRISHTVPHYPSCITHLNLSLPPSQPLTGRAWSCLMWAACHQARAVISWIAWLPHAPVHVHLCPCTTCIKHNSSFAVPVTTWLNVTSLGVRCLCAAHTPPTATTTATYRH